MKRQVYVLNPKELTPETIAVTFAKTSRSPQTFREIAQGLTDEKSSEFHEKWVVGYGHSSVAEHAVLHVAFENVSRLAVEAIESCRLASYTEKSTRYQKWDLTDYHTPAELQDSPHLQLYTQTIQALFQTYHECLAVCDAWLEKNAPWKPGEEATSRSRRLRVEAIDSCRFLLPSAALANVGMTVNARVLEGAISKFLSHPLEEVREVGNEVKIVSQLEVPTLVKYAAPSRYLQEITTLFSSTPANNPSSDCQLWDYDEKAVDKMLAASLFRFAAIPLQQAQEQIAALQPAERKAMLDEILAGVQPYELPIRETEHMNFTFELIMDQGAYYEFKRHRMMSLTAQDLTADLGFTTPRMIAEAGCRPAYTQAMELAKQTWKTIYADLPHVAAYCVPNGFNRRMLASINYRSLFHLIRLRTKANAHYSIRKVGLKMAESVSQVLTELGPYLTPVTGETWQSIDESYFA